MGAVFGAVLGFAATFLGTMGLPHVLVRYYTNPDGIGARRTTVTVIGDSSSNCTTTTPAVTPGNDDGTPTTGP